MPGGISNIGLGYLTYAAIKFAGYGAAAYALNRSYETERHHFLKVGLTRTIVGLVLGAVFGGLMFLPMVLMGEMMFAVFLLALIPLRFFEWWIVLWLFYEPKNSKPWKNWRNVVVCSVWSFVLDVPAIMGVVSTGGFWIC